jgi:hypothetical protein
MVAGGRRGAPAACLLRGRAAEPLLPARPLPAQVHRRPARLHRKVSRPSPRARPAPARRRRRARTRQGAPVAGGAPGSDPQLEPSPPGFSPSWSCRCCSRSSSGARTSPRRLGTRPPAPGRCVRAGTPAAACRVPPPAVGSRPLALTARSNPHPPAPPPEPHANLQRRRARHPHAAVAALSSRPPAVHPRRPAARARPPAHRVAAGASRPALHGHCRLQDRLPACLTSTHAPPAIPLPDHTR